MSKLVGKVAVVTGASKGIGAGTSGFHAFHCCAIRTGGVVNDPLGGIDLVIVFTTEIRKTFGNGLKPLPFRAQPAMKRRR